jgi:hypothetical protein
MVEGHPEVTPIPCGNKKNRVKTSQKEDDWRPPPQNGTT